MLGIKSRLALGLGINESRSFLCAVNRNSGESRCLEVNLFIRKGQKSWSQVVSMNYTDSSAIAFNGPT